MSVMTVGNKDVSNALAPGGCGDRRPLAFVGRTPIDESDQATTHDISIGAEEGVGPWIVGDDAPDAGRDLMGHDVVDVKVAIEGKLRRHGVAEMLAFPRT